MIFCIVSSRPRALGSSSGQGSSIPCGTFEEQAVERFMVISVTGAKYSSKGALRSDNHVYEPFCKLAQLARNQGKYILCCGSKESAVTVHGPKVNNIMNETSCTRSVLTSFD